MTTSKKILICGYSHCGTTILKSIIGHIEDVEEIIDECDNVRQSTNKNIYCANFHKHSQNFLI